MKAHTALIFSLWILASAAQAQNPEPAYCNPKTFETLEVKAGINQAPDRLKVYKLGSAYFAGMAVGNSDFSQVQSVAKKFSTSSTRDNFCTWYVNDGNHEAEVSFNHQYLENPRDLDVATGPQEYLKVIGDDFSRSANNFLTCFEKHKYVGVGCNGMKHRGPTLFAMVLAYSGCLAKNAAKIANTLWGLNGVNESVRQAIVQGAYDLGTSEPDARLRMQKVFTP